MGNKKITMQKLRQVLRFYSQGKGTKTISSIVGISRNTVKKYLQIFHTCLLYTSPSPRDAHESRMPSSA